MITFLIQLLLSVIGMFCAVKLRRLPNWLTLGGCAAGIVAAGLAQGWGGLWSATLGCLGAMSMLLPLSLIGLAGPGDLKLAGAIGAVVGWSAVGLLGLCMLGAAAAVLVVRTVTTGALRRLLAWILMVLGLIRFGGNWRRHLAVQTAGKFPLAAILLTGSFTYLMIRVIHV